MKIKKSFLVGVSIIALTTVGAYAQTFQGLGALDDLADSAHMAGPSVINIAFIVIGIVAGIMLIPASIKAWQGDERGKDAIIAIGLGLIACYIILGIVKLGFGF